MSIVEYEVRSKVATIRLNDPKRRNPLSEELTWALVDALKRAEAAEDVNVVLISAAGESFSAGGDLQEFKTFRDIPAPDIFARNEHTAELFKLLGEYRKPAVAAVNGPAFGGGCGLACACPVVIASDAAKFGTTEIRLGLFPLVIFPAVRKAVGDRRALKMALTGEILTAEAAKAAGIVTDIVPADKLADESFAFCEKVAANSPYALSLGMRAFRLSSEIGHAEAVEYLSALRVMFYGSLDLREGASAFLEKRAPNWVGR